MWRVTEVNMVSDRIKLGDDDGRMMTFTASQFERVDNRWRVKAHPSS
jgi:hypothetical protein